MKRLIETAIDAGIGQYCESAGKPRLWETAIVRCGDANREEFAALRAMIPNHALPADFLPGASIVISYFLPFIQSIAAGNSGNGDIASPEWADAYLFTNAMAMQVNQDLCNALAANGRRAAAPADIGMDAATLTSRWSQRHVAWICGHGTFGLNNMLIGERGCCGRYFSIIADAPIEADPMVRREACIAKRTGGCKLCVKRCPSGALSLAGFDRQACYQTCLKNDALYPGADVCGKCVVGLPCSFAMP